MKILKDSTYKKLIITQEELKCFNNLLKIDNIKKEIDIVHLNWQLREYKNTIEKMIEKKIQTKDKKKRDNLINKNK